MYTCDINNPSPLSLHHLREDTLNCVKVGTKVQGDHFLPNIIGELFYSINVLHACIVDKDIDFAEMFSGILNQSLTIGGLSEISIEELSLDDLLGDLVFYFLDFLVRCKSIQGNVGSSSR